MFVVYRKDGVVVESAPFVKTEVGYVAQTKNGFSPNECYDVTIEPTDPLQPNPTGEK